MLVAAAALQETRIDACNECVVTESDVSFAVHKSNPPGTGLRTIETASGSDIRYNDWA